MNIVRLDRSDFYWRHHKMTAVMTDHYTLVASRNAPPLPAGFYCMVKRLTDRRWFWHIGRLRDVTAERKGTVVDRAVAMKKAEDEVRKILASLAESKTSKEQMANADN